MNRFFTSVVSILMTIILGFTPKAQAEEKVIDDYIVYYNVFNSSFIAPEVATQYKIPRSGHVAVLNISIHKKPPQNTSPEAFTALKANVQGRAKNLIGQYEDLAFREIIEDQAIYYLADFPFRPKEQTDVEFSIRLADRKSPITINLQKVLYQD